MTPKFWCGPTGACMPAEYFDQWASANPNEARIWTPLFTADQVAEAVMDERELVLTSVENRLRAWRQRSMNRSGDMLALDDFMGQDSIEDLVDHVCNRYAP